MIFLCLSFWKMKEDENLNFPTYSSFLMYFPLSLRTMMHIPCYLGIIYFFGDSEIGINTLA